MRKVKFKKYIPIEWITDPDNPARKKQKKGTGFFEKEFLDSGLFHQWASNYEEGENNYGNYTVALVELEDGTIVEVTPVNLKFDDKLEASPSSS